MTPERRACLKRLVDEARRAVLTGSPRGDPTLWGQCLYCGTRFALVSRAHRRDYCTRAHKSNAEHRRTRLRQITTAAERQAVLESCDDTRTGVESMSLPPRSLAAA